MKLRPSLVLRHLPLMCLWLWFVFPLPGSELFYLPQATIRKQATNQVLPAYPADALRDHLEGVAVAEIEGNDEGKLIRVTILEAPSESITRSMIDALYQWKLPKTTYGGVTLRLVGKVTFYFFIRAGRGQVVTPEAAASSRMSNPKR